jgi:hypothetical protein
MIDKLKYRVEEKIGCKITNRGDCQLLSNAILDVVGVDISYNTIRRLYDLAPRTKPNKRTLDALAMFIGYKNYVQFTQDYDIIGKQNSTNKIYKLIYAADKRQILKTIEKTKNSQEDFTEFITLLVRELFHDKNYGLIDEIFKLNALQYQNFTYSELLHIGNCIGLIIRKQEFSDMRLINNTNFLHCVYLTFVDYSSLNGYYGQWANHIFKQKHHDEIRIFCSAIIELRKFLNNERINFHQEELIYSNQLNPILCSRLLSLTILKNDKINIDELLGNYFKAHSKKSNLTDFSFELFTTSILIKNVALMAFLIEKLNFKIEYYYQKSHRNSYYLMCGFYYKLTKQKRKEKEYMSLFNLEECRYSYEEFITVFYLIYSFHNTTIEADKREFKERYFKAVKNLDYAYFNESFLTHYFEENAH